MTIQEAFDDIWAIFYKAAELCRREGAPLELVTSEEEEVLAILNRLKEE